MLFAVMLTATACKDDINEVNVPLSVTTPEVSSVNITSAVVSSTATGSHIIYRGVCYSTSANPTVDDNKVLASKKDMKLIVSGLATGTTYYVRSFAQTSYNTVYSDAVSFTTLTTASVEDDEQTEGPAALKRVSVHDPSVVFDPQTSTYYVFGSHRAAAKSPNLMTWTAFTAPWATASSSNAANDDAFTTPQVTKVTKGGVEYDFTFDAFEWSKKGNASFSIDGNMWAPDVIYNKAMKALKNFSAAEKSLAPIQASVTNYEVGDTETFYTLEPVKKESFNKLTYKLLVSKDNYNIWVNTADTYYKKDQDAFQTAAEKLGEVFINGYNIVSHIYGEPTSYIYTSIKNGTPSKYANMATYSRTGTKINIMLSEMLKGGVLGFVYHGDSAAHLKATDGSNEGRFLYMDSQTLMENKSQAYSTALHEFSHAISFNMKYFEQNVQWTYWYGEMLAMMCEDMMQNYLDIGDSDAPKGRLPSANCNAWLNGLSGQDSLTYAAAFQLGAWLSRKFGGVKVIRELARNGKVDFDSILAAVETASGKTYTKTSLLQEMAEDLLQEKTDSGFNQDAPTYASDATYTCSYSGGTYTYPLTAINLWNKSYGWADIGGFSNIDGENYISNQSILFSELPVDNIFAEADWSKTAEPTVAYIGPLQLASGAVYANIGPSSNMLFKLGTASSDTVTITFMCQGGYYFGDEITVWAK